MTDERRESDAGASAGDPRPIARVRGALVLGAASVAGGIALAGSVDRKAGGALVVAAWLLLAWAIHRYGRLSSAPRR